MTSLRRLTKEFEAFEKNPLDYCEITPADDKMSAEAQLQGPAGTPYANGVWTIDLTFPENYPFKAPTVTFRTEIKHPNVKTDTGEVYAIDATPVDGARRPHRSTEPLRPPHAIDVLSSASTARRPRRSSSRTGRPP